MLTATLHGTEAAKRDMVRMASQAPAAMRRGIARGGLVLERHLREVSLSGGGPASRTLKRRTGGLARGVGQRAVDDGLTRYVGTDKFYILTHEGMVSGVYGGHVVIRPRRGRYLRFKIGKGKSAQWVTTNESRIPIRAPIMFTYEQKMRDAQLEAWRTAREVIAGKTGR